MGPMIDVPGELVMRSLVGAGLDHASCLGRYDDATAGLGWLRNNGNPRFGATMPPFRPIAQRIPPLLDRPSRFHNFVWLNLREHLRLICRLMKR